MNFYAATLVELLIIELFVFGIWFKVLLEAMRTRDGSMSAKKLLLTSIGLVLSSVAVAGIMGFRIYELTIVHRPFVWAIVTFYIMLAIGGFLFMLSATIGESTRLLKSFTVVTAIWTLVAFYWAH